MAHVLDHNHPKYKEAIEVLEDEQVTMLGMHDAMLRKVTIVNTK